MLYLCVILSGAKNLTLVRGGRMLFFRKSNQKLLGKSIRFFTSVFRIPRNATRALSYRKAPVFTTVGGGRRAPQVRCVFRARPPRPRILRSHPSKYGDLPRGATTRFAVSARAAKSRLHQYTPENAQHFLRSFCPAFFKSGRNPLRGVAEFRNSNPKKRMFFQEKSNIRFPKENLQNQPRNTPKETDDAHNL